MSLVSPIGRQIITFLCIASFLAVPVRIASNGLAVVLYASPAAVDKPGASCPMCSAGHGGICRCPCCQAHSCSCSLTSGEEDDRLMVLVLENSMPPKQPESPPELPSTALAQPPYQNVAEITSPVPTPPPKS